MTDKRRQLTEEISSLAAALEDLRQDLRLAKMEVADLDDLIAENKSLSKSLRAELNLTK